MGSVAVSAGKVCGLDHSEACEGARSSWILILLFGSRWGRKKSRGFWPEQLERWELLLLRWKERDGRSRFRPATGWKGGSLLLNRPVGSRAERLSSSRERWVRETHLGVVSR